MILDIQKWVDGHLKDGSGCWDLQKWEDLRAEFEITLILPRNTTLSIDSLKEMQIYANTAMICISFLESAELLGVSLCGREVLLEKRWLYDLIIFEIRECIGFLNQNFEHNFQGITDRACSILRLPFKYALTDLRLVEVNGQFSNTIH